MANATKNSNGNTAIEKRQDKPETVNVPQRVEQAGQAEQAEQEPRAPQAYYTPLVDVLENNEAFVFQADLPGVRAQDLDVRFENGVLTIEGRVAPRQPQGRSYLWREYGVGHFYRSFHLETPVNADGIKAQLRNGVLELWVPKAESARSRRIDIKTA